MENINVNFVLIGCVVYLLLIIISYFEIFRKYNKRNQLDFWEILDNLGKFFIKTTGSLFAFLLGIYCFIEAYISIETRSEVVMYIIGGIIIDSVTILYYKNYIKKSLIDIESSKHESQRKKNIQSGDIIVLIVLILFMLNPIFRINSYIDAFKDKKEFILLIVQSILISIASFVVLLSYNPLNVGSKILGIKDSDNENQDINNENDEVIEKEEQEIDNDKKEKEENTKEKDKNEFTHENLHEDIKNLVKNDKLEKNEINKDPVEEKNIFPKRY